MARKYASPDKAGGVPGVIALVAGVFNQEDRSLLGDAGDVSLVAGVLNQEDRSLAGDVVDVPLLDESEAASELSHDDRSRSGDGPGDAKPPRAPATVTTATSKNTAIRNNEFLFWPRRRFTCFLIFVFFIPVSHREIT